MDELRVAAHGFDESLDILRYVERIHPGVAFHKTLTLRVQQAERLLPAAVAHPRAGKALLGVEGIAPVGGTLPISLRHFGVARF